jgi:hypothetical protein
MIDLKGPKFNGVRRMKIQKVLLTILGVFGVSVGGGMMAAHPAEAAVKQCQGLTEEECCQEALRKNTVEALEAFLRKYPPGRNSNSTCSALALSALPDRESHGEEGGDNGYNR